ncbi:MAG TPA: helix-turn-helix transcriptional regulator [Burkholderiales bacterium]|nr:helix-turn-helix transcriptional regulator [Burkholderiales bacterium]
MTRAWNSQLDPLINRLYDAAIDESLWTGMAAEIATAFRSTSAVLKAHGAGNHIELVEVTENLAVPQKDTAWADHWHKNDLWVERSAAFGLNRVVTSDHLLPDAEFAKTGFYQDWVRRLGIYHMIGAVFPLARDTMGVIGIHRPQSGGAYTGDDEILMERFLPHVRRALRLRSQLAEASLVRTASLEALDRIDTAVLVLNTSGHVLYANGLAEEILRASSAVSVCNGKLTCSTSKLQAELMRQVEEACTERDRVSQAPRAAMLIHRYPRLPLTLLVSPLSGRWQRSDTIGPAAIVFIKDPEQAGLALETLRELFGLTRTEAAIAAALAEGKDLTEIAATFQIGIGTVRSHLKKMLTKTGTHRQAQIVALFARSVATVVRTAKHPAPQR